MKPSTRAFFALSMVILSGAALLHLLVLMGVPGIWPAFIHMSLYGWITAMIYAVNYHTMPVFSARDFPAPRLIWAHGVLFAGGVLLATMGLLSGEQVLRQSGLLLELGAALIFTANTLLLFTRGIPRPHRPPLPPIPDQTRVDRLGTQATKGAGLSLLLALILFWLAHANWISATWILAAEHLMALGWVLLMIVGVAYHVLPRFSGRGIRGATWAQAQIGTHIAALVLMIVALGAGWPPLFALSGVLMSGAVALFAWTIWPTLRSVVARPGPIQVTVKERVS